MRYIAPKPKEVLREVTEPTFGEIVKTPSRAEVRRNSAENVNAVDIDGVFTGLFEVLGTTDISDSTRDLKPTEIDVLAAEVLAVRKAKDVVEGRESALKTYATEVINNRIAREGNDPNATSGVLISTEFGVKLSKEVSGGKLNVEVDLLREVLEDDQFYSVVNVVEIVKKTTYPGGKTVHEEETIYELNEDALERQLNLGNIGMEQILSATRPGKSRTAFYVRDIK